jgi:trimeric autotransporter adhesin
VNLAFGVAVDTSGNIYIADTYNHRIRLVTKSTGIITTVAGDGTQGFEGDGGLATSARFDLPYGIAVDTLGNIYIADYNNDRVRVVTKSTGVITTVAGDGTSGYSRDGVPATSTGLQKPHMIAVDTSGNVYIADSYSSRVRMVTKSTGIITTVAGDGTRGHKGDGGLATSAGLFNPAGVAVDASGNIYIADSFHIRMVTKSTGIITTVAGDGTEGYKGDGGLATAASLFYAFGVAVDASGNIYIADTDNDRIRLVTKSTGIITTVAGGGVKGDVVSLGDGGQATSAYVYAPRGIAIDASGNIYIATPEYHRIRHVNPMGLALTTPPLTSPTRPPTTPPTTPPVTSITRPPTRPPTTPPTTPPATSITPPPTRPPTSPPSLSSRPSSLPSGKTLSSQCCKAVTRK